MQIYILSLAPNSNEVTELLAQLKSQNLKGEVLLGVDGRKGFPAVEQDENINQTRSLKMRLVELTSGEIGCYLSHLRAIKKAFKQGYERICILEDDVLIEDDFATILSEVKNLSSEVELVRLMGLKTHKRKIVDRLGESHNLTRPIKGLCGTQGYVLNRSGMQKVIYRGSSVAEPIDKFYDHFWDIDLKTYNIEPHLIWERTDTKSAIAKISRNKAAKPLRKRISKHYIKIVRSLKRRAYILKYQSEFKPATIPIGKMGRTARMK